MYNPPKRRDRATTRGKDVPLTGPAGIEPATPGLERTPSNAGVAAFVDFQGLSSEQSTPASLDDAGVGTNPGTARSRSGRWALRPSGPNYFTVMLPAVTVAVGNATALRISPRLPVAAVTVKGTPTRGKLPSPMSTVAVPLNVALPPTATEPLLTSPSTVTFCGAPRSDVPISTA